MKNKPDRSSHQLWAEFRFSVVGALLADPPEAGALRGRLRALAATEWTHPVEGNKFQVSLPTIERWYYSSSKQDRDPVGALRRKLRVDAGTTRHLTLEIKNWLQNNYRAHSSWSVQLHADNLRVWLGSNPSFGASPSYPTVLRYMRGEGWIKTPRVRSPFAPGRFAAEARLQAREVRSFEVEFVGGLWHLDFHHASRSLRTPRGEVKTPLALCVLDDHSRLACHIQWYWAEDTRALVHGFTQALQKRGLPRALLTDNGSAMISGEFTQGLSRLGIAHETTLAYSPFQNGKQESFWGILEGRLMAMLEGRRDLTLEELNSVSSAWVEMEYNRRLHSQTEQTPVERFLGGKSVLRGAPEGSVLASAFRRDEKRTQRISDGTISLLGKRFEIPAAFRALYRLTVRFAEWDLTHVSLVDTRTDAVLAPLYPLDRLRNSEGLRKKISQASSTLPSDKASVPPLLQKLVADYAASGLPPAYIAQADADADANKDSSQEQATTATGEKQ